MGTAIGRGAGSALLVLLMAVGSVAMWIGVPVLWLWIASQVHKSSQPSMGIYFLVLVGIIATMAVLGKLLGVVNRWHMALTGKLPRRREQTVWLKSMRGERNKQREHGILATVMAISVGSAMVLAGIWFLLFARGGGI
jgi:hypothetical protein